MVKDARASLDTYVLFRFSSPKSTEGGIYFHKVMYKLYELNQSVSSISVVLIHEIRVFTSSNTSVGSGCLFSRISLNVFVIVVISLKIGDNIYSRDIIFITGNRGTVFDHTRE